MKAHRKLVRGYEYDGIGRRRQRGLRSTGETPAPLSLRCIDNAVPQASSL